MNPRFVPGWMRILPIMVAAVLALAGSAGFAPAPVAASPPASSPGWASEVTVARVAPQPPAVPLPGGALGRLAIDSIGVNAIARTVGLNAGGAMDVTPDIWEVGVFNGAVQPGQPGSAVIEGHLDWYTGPAVFWNLHRVGMGSEVDYTGADGVLHRFAVSRVRNIPWNSAIPEDLFSRTGTPTITMITCSGTWISSAHSYSTRLLLTATEITS